MLLGVLEITPLGALCVAGWVVAGFAIGKLLFQDDRRLKAFQADCGELGQELSRWGFNLLPPVLIDISLGDFVKLGYDVKHAIRTCRDPQAFADDMSKVTAGIVKQLLSDRATAQTFLDDVVALGKQHGLAPSATALAGAVPADVLSKLAAGFTPEASGIAPALTQQVAADQALAGSAPGPVTVHVHNAPAAPADAAPAKT